MLRYALDDDGIARIHLDDGKANALGPPMITALSTALDKAADEAAAVVIAGREGRFCAGFDLKIMGAGPQAAIELVTSGADLLLKLYEHPKPIVAACTGHALAGGAVMLLCCDTRIGVDVDDVKIGLNEVAIGMPVPVFVEELAQARLARNELVAAVLQSQKYTPSEAARVGFLDRVVPPAELEQAALATARALADLPSVAYASTKRSLRAPTIAHVRTTLQDDMERLMRDLAG